MSDRREVSQGVNILVIDSGGASGLSSLMILDQAMDRLQHIKGLSHPSEIYEEFDIVAGTGTGAISICMVGRLRIPLKQAIRYYATLAEVFSDRKTFGTSAFKMTKLKEVLKKIVRESTGEEEARMMDTRPDAAKCRTMVFAMSRYNMNAGLPSIFRSYQGTENQMPDCTIWEALCASMAHPELFKSIDIGEPHMRESFVDSALGCPNPIAHVLAEAKMLFPDRHVGSILSIGNGHSRTIQIPKPSPLHRFLPTNVIVTMKDIATDSERVAQEMEARFRGTTDVYFRFSVDQGMQSMRLSDWEKLSEVTAHTRAYMRRAEVNDKLNRAAEAISNRKKSISALQIDGQIHTLPTQVVPSVKICPAPTPVFTGQEQKVEQVTACISRGDKERCVFVLHGLGGSGKTQIALKTVENTRDLWSDVIFIDATSRETTISALEGFARARKMGTTYMDTAQWLSAQKTRWLLIFDNADDPQTSIRDFFPSGSHGSILITTRIPDLALLAQGPHSDYRVSNMEQEEAMDLLMKTARVQIQDLVESERKAARDLLKDVGYLALAIVHAGAYIWCSKRSISDYYATFLSQRRATLEGYNDILVKVDDYAKSVYTTWHMSYELLGTQAKQLLALMAYMHHDSITEDIFRQAALNLQTYEGRIPLSDEETEVRTYIASCLDPYLDSVGGWNSGAFLKAMMELLSYSLISYDQVNSVYTLHVLVHDWASTVVSYPQATAVERTMLLLAVSIDIDDAIESLAFKRAVEIHVGRVLDQKLQPRANYAVYFGKLYCRTGKWNKEEAMRRIVVEACKEALGPEHRHTLTGMHDLAVAYENQGRYEQAETLLLQVLDAFERTLGDDHPHTLDSLANLAITYRSLGRYEQAETLELQVLDARKRTLGDDHPHTLSSMANLASTYGSLGRYEQAETLQLQVLDARKRTLGDDHPDTLTSMANLASTYWSLGRYEQAETLELQVLDAYKRTLGDDHPDTLNSMGNLASTYWSLGRYEQAETLQLQVLDAYKRTLGDDHPHTLNSMAHLASTYWSLGRYEQAETLQLQVLDGCKRTLGDDHPDTLNSMGNLASTYWSLGRYEQAETLDLQVLDARKRTLGDDHPKTLNSMANLASTYWSLGRYEQAETLQLQVLDARKRTLGDDHPDTLTSMHNLAATYHGQGRHESAESLMLAVVNVRKRRLGDKHPGTLESMRWLAIIYQSLGREREQEGRMLQIEILRLAEEAVH